GEGRASDPALSVMGGSPALRWKGPAEAGTPTGRCLRDAALATSRSPRATLNWSCTFWRQRAGRGGIEMAGSLPPRVLSRADPSRLRSRRVRAARWRWALCLGALAMIAIVAAPDGALPPTRGG